MPIARTIAWIALAAASIGIACAQDFPHKPIRIVTTTAGGGNDFAARIIAQGLKTAWGQPVIVDNRSSSAIPGDVVARAAPDGYTILVAGGTFAIGPLLQSVPYDPVKDFTPITLAASAPLVLIVNPALPAKSVKEVIAVSKTRSDGLNFSSAGIGSSAHLAGELFKYLTGAKMTHIPYKGSGPATTALIRDEVQMAFGNASSVVPHIKSNRVRALAVTTAEPSTLFPGLPTLAASLPGYESASLVGVFAPARTPATIVNRLNQEIVNILTQPEIKAKFFATGAEVVASSPQAYAAIVKSEIARMEKLIKSVGIRGK